jgi:hypothetical protein
MGMISATSADCIDDADPSQSDGTTHNPEFAGRVGTLVENTTSVRSDQGHDVRPLEATAPGFGNHRCSGKRRKRRPTGTEARSQNC